MEYTWRNAHIYRSSIESDCTINTFYAEQGGNILSTLFQKSIITKIQSTMEIPCFCKDHILTVLQSGATSGTIVIPLGRQSNRDFIKKTGDTIIYSLFTNRNMALTCIKDGKDNTYYGFSGLILNSELSPLLITTIKVDVDFTTHTLSNVQPVVRINPIVFDSPNVVEKTIVKKLILFYSTHTVDIYLSNSSHNNLIPKVLIGNLDDLFASCNTPNIQDCSDEQLNNLIVDNINNLSL